MSWKIRNLIVSVAILMICSPVWAESYAVQEVMDAVTLKLTNGWEVRLIGILPPQNDEMKQEAKEFVRKLVEGKEAMLRFDVEKKDRIDRLLAYLYFTHIPWEPQVDEYYYCNIPLEPEKDKDGNSYVYETDRHRAVFLNATILKSGYARSLPIMPNVKHSDLFEELSQEAKADRRGLWGQKPERNISTENLTRKSCEIQGGQWRSRNDEKPQGSCYLPARDEGRECRDYADCECDCIAELTEEEYERGLGGEVLENKTGKCSKWPLSIGCWPKVRNGKVNGILCEDM